MKKSIWIAFLFMAAALVVLPVAYKEIDGWKERITVTEEVIFGDPEAAAGITLWTAIHLEKHLLWNTEYIIGSGKQAENCFTFSSKEASTQFDSSQLEGEYMKGGLLTGGFGSVGTSAPGNNVVDLDWVPLPEIVMAVAERTGAGKENTEKIRLCDYYEYYPIEMSICPAVSYVEFIADYADEREYLQNLFRIPVEKETVVEVTVRKDLEGNIVWIHCGTAENPMAIEDVYAFGEKGCYYAYYYENWETGEILDSGQNNGIFYLPYAESGLRKGSDYAKVDLTLMEKVCELPKDAALAQMMLDKEKERLYLVMKGQEGYSLAIYSLEGAVPVLEQEMPVLQTQEPPLWVRMTMEEDGLFLVWQDNSFSFLTEEDGKYKLWCSGVFPQSENLRQEKEMLQKSEVIQQERDVFLNENALFFDGERLALAAYEQRGISVRLAVYGQEGMRYSGIYRNSMEEGYYGGLIEKQGVRGFFGFSRNGNLLKPLELKDGR